MDNLKPKIFLACIFAGIVGMSCFYVINRAGLSVLLSALISLIVMGAAGLAAVTNLLKPLSKFQVLIEKISAGYLKVPFDINNAGVISDIGDSIDRAITGFKSLIDISQLLSKETILDHLLNLIISETTKLMNAERTTLFFYNKENKELWSYIAQELEIKEIRLPLGKGAAGYVAKTGKILNIPDAYNDSHFDRSSDKATGFITRNILSVPMYDHKTEVLGVIQVLNKSGGPFNSYDESLLTALAGQASIAIENARLYESQEHLFKSFIRTMAAVVDARDTVTMGHSDRVAKYSVAIGKAMGLSQEEIRILDYSAILHDVGKISIPDAVLLKPGSFTPEEYEVIKEHTIHTRNILSNIYSSSELKHVPLIASSHHEKLDGSGYPMGLKNNDIPLPAKIICVADIYDALVSYDRPYKRAFPVEKALAILKDDAYKGKFDENIVNLFIEKKLYELERREFIRVSGDFTLEYRKIGPEEWKDILPILTQTSDVSAGGIQFETADNIEKGNYLEVKLHIKRFTVDAIAKVVRKETVDGKTRLGIQFVNLSNDFKKRLANYLTDMDSDETPVKA